MRWTALRLIPTALATMRPVQWVAALGGSPQGSASTRAMVAGDNAALPDLRVYGFLPLPAPLVIPGQIRLRSA